MEKQYRSIVFYGNYFYDFYDTQSKKVQMKIDWTLELIASIHKVPETYLKHLENTDGLYEIRVQSGSNIFRIFCFFDEGKLIVTINGFQKKTQKTPNNEVEKAQKIKSDYYENKRK